MPLLRRGCLPVTARSILGEVSQTLKVLKSRLTRRVFTRIYVKRKWHLIEGTVSGSGSTLAATETVRAVLPELLREFKIRSMLDIPCGDFFWMKELEFGQTGYIGADIVGPMVEENRRRFARNGRTFLVADLIRDALPQSELVLCRDCLIHLSNEDALKAIRNVKRSGARYFLTTTYAETPSNQPILTGRFRPVNLERPPFGLPSPLRLINENCPADGGKWKDKSLGLWRVADLP